MAAWPEFQLGALLGALAAGRVDFVVIGGVAAIGHGSAQFTRDLDIAYAGDDRNLRALGAVLVGLEARLRGVEGVVPFVPDERTLRRVQVLTLDTRLGPLDLLGAPAGAPPYPVLRERSIPINVAGADIRIAAIDDLIAMKRAAGRGKDLLVVDELEALRRLGAG